jgi:hypothetical protein
MGLLGIEWWASKKGDGDGDDVIFPNIDMCLITLVGRFS